MKHWVKAGDARWGAIKFVVLSLAGVLLFLVPVPCGGGGVTVSMLGGALRRYMGSALPALVLGVFAVTFLLSVAALFRPGFMRRSLFLSNLFFLAPVGFVLRVVGVVLAGGVWFEKGPAVLIGSSTGGMVFYELLPTLAANLVCATLFFPLLLEFGLLEFVGTLLAPWMRRVFCLPGRAAVDCLASWVGDGSIGTMLTLREYDQGYYTDREACILVTNFSAVSITFCLTVAAQVGLGHRFGSFYGTVVVASLVAALVLPRLYPLASKQGRMVEGGASDGESVWKRGWSDAVARAERESVLNAFHRGAKGGVEMLCGLLPMVMCIATVSLAAAEHTPLFVWMGAPFVGLLDWCGVPEAVGVSQTLFVGFADMLIPSILATKLKTEMARFVVAALSVSQLVYLSELGALLLGSKLPLRLWELAVIFLQRTLVVLPIIVALAHFFCG